MRNAAKSKGKGEAEKKGDWKRGWKQKKRRRRRTGKNEKSCIRSPPLASFGINGEGADVLQPAARRGSHGAAPALPLFLPLLFRV